MPILTVLYEHTLGPMNGRLRDVVLEEGSAADRMALLVASAVFPLFRWAPELEELFLPAAPPVGAPIFILGHPRSGTTSLHRSLVAAVGSEATGARLLDVIVPSAMVRAMFPLGLVWDQLGIQDNTLRATGPGLPEEEDHWLMWRYRHPAVRMLFGARVRDRIWGNYATIFTPNLGDLACFRRCISRRLWWASKRLWVGKPLFLGTHFGHEQLRQEFPDARIVWLHRNGSDAIGSYWKKIAQDGTQPASRGTLERGFSGPTLAGIEAARLAFQRSGRRADSDVWLGFDDWILDPLGAMRRILGALGLRQDTLIDFRAEVTESHRGQDIRPRESGSSQAPAVALIAALGSVYWALLVVPALGCANLSRRVAGHVGGVKRD